MKLFDLSVPYQEDINKAVLKVLDSKRFIGGEEVCKLEERIADFHGVKLL